MWCNMDSGVRRVFLFLSNVIRPSEHGSPHNGCFRRSLFGELWIIDTHKRRFLTNLAGPPYPADAFAEEALAAIARNRAVIVIPRRARLAWRLGRLFPGLAEKASEKFVTIERRHRSP